MARGFSEEEKIKIKSQLLEKGRELFSQYGLKKTGVKDLTQAVGIAQGSFYSFFESKEVLFFYIIGLEEDRIKKALFDKGIINEKLTQRGFNLFLKASLEELDKSEILKRLYLEGEYETLLRKLPQSIIDEHIQGDEDLLQPLINHWQQEGTMIKKEPAVIAGLIRSIFTITLHRKEIGEAVFEDTLDLLIECVAKGLIIEGERS